MAFLRWYKKRSKTFTHLTFRLGLPIYRGGFPRYNCLDNMLNPRASLPPTAVTRDPFWYDLGDLGLRPFQATSGLPPFLRESYLSPVKRRYLWSKHPIRPFGKPSRNEFGACTKQFTLKLINSFFLSFVIVNNAFWHSFRGRARHPLKFAI